MVRTHRGEDPMKAEFMWERISKEKTSIRWQVGESRAISESRNKVKKGEV